MTIHVIDDDTLYAEFIRRSLGLNQEYKITVFKSAEAWLEANPEMPDAMISDYFLPAMTGIDLYDAIKHRLKPENRFILISSITDGKMVLNFIKKGIRDYVIKDDSTIGSLRAILEGKEDEYYLFD
jgi:DNA-binding NarL/FixJ family response regulator